MSQAPYAVRDIRFGTRLGSDPKMEDTLWAGLTDAYCKVMSLGKRKGQEEEPKGGWRGEEGKKRREV